MTIFVAEIEARAIIAFSAENSFAAKALMQDESMRAELTSLESEGRPLWDAESEIFVWKAFREEEATWKKSRAKAVLAGDDAAAEDGWVVFLVPTTDPSDDD
jgi:hypothetical protein